MALSPALRAIHSHMPPWDRNSHFHTRGAVPLRACSTVSTRRRHVGQWWQLPLVRATSISTRLSSTITARLFDQPSTRMRVSSRDTVAVDIFSAFLGPGPVCFFCSNIPLFRGKHHKAHVAKERKTILETGSSKPGKEQRWCGAGCPRISRASKIAPCSCLG